MLLCGADSTLALVAERLSARSSDVYSVGFSPDGTRIVSGSRDKSIQLWGELRLLALCSLKCSWWQPCAQCVVADGVGARRTYAATLAPLDERTSAHSSDVYSVSFSPDGTKIVSGSSDNSIRLWGGQRSLALCSCVLLTVDSGSSVGSL